MRVLWIPEVPSGAPGVPLPQRQIGANWANGFIGPKGQHWANWANWAYRLVPGLAQLAYWACWAIGLICHLGKLAQRKNGYDRRVIHVKGLEMLSFGVKMAEEFG